jgi:hypothetical protein
LGKTWNALSLERAQLSASATRIIGGGIANSTRPPSSGTASSSTFGTKSGIFAIS